MARSYVENMDIGTVATMNIDEPVMLREATTY
jgi:hypothetical protein